MHFYWTSNDNMDKNIDIEYIWKTEKTKIVM